jgi:hypothetical protein
MIWDFLKITLPVFFENVKIHKFHFSYVISFFLSFFFFFFFFDSTGVYTHGLGLARQALTWSMPPTLFTLANFEIRSYIYAWADLGYNPVYTAHVSGLATATPSLLVEMESCKLSPHPSELPAWLSCDFFCVHSASIWMLPPVSDSSGFIGLYFILLLFY